MELASGLTLLDIEIVSSGPIFFVFFLWHAQLRPSWLPNDCSSSKGYTISASNPVSENKNLFPHGLRMGSVRLPKGEVQFCMIQKERVCPCVKCPATTASESKEERCQVCGMQWSRNLSAEQVCCQPQVKLPGPLVPGQPLSNGKLPFSSLVREWAVWLDSTSC